TGKIISSDELDIFKIEKESLRKKTQIKPLNSGILDSLRFLNIPEIEIKTYTTLMTLGSASTSIISKVMKMEEDIIKKTLIKLEKQKWVMRTNGMYSSNNPNLVINNEINRMRNDFFEKIKEIKTQVLPNLETVYLQNNHVRQEESYD
ncbi:MAG: helix-turn-helix domain-containing protein, partial [Promethearchaeota archaeon]